MDRAKDLENEISAFFFTQAAISFLPSNVTIVSGVRFPFAPFTVLMQGAIAQLVEQMYRQLAFRFFLIFFKITTISGYQFSSF